MKKMSAVPIFVIFSLVVILALAACADNTPAPAEPEPAPVEAAPAPAATPAPELEPEPEPALFEEVSFMAEDDIKVTADLYKIDDESAPYILLFHRGGSSRGEYIEIAPRLNDMGYNCLAVDTRHGGSINEVSNKTAKAAANKYGNVYNYNEAWPDVKAALVYAQEELKAEKIIVWGSSYTAAFALILGSEFAEDISAVLAFSPGGYFSLNGNPVAHYAKNVRCPVFVAVEVVSEWADSPYDYPVIAKELYDVIPGENKVLFMPDVTPGWHGSCMLYSKFAYSELYWEQVIAFLDSLEL